MRSSGRMRRLDHAQGRRLRRLDVDDLLAAPILHRLEEAAEYAGHLGNGVFLLHQGHHASASEEAAGEHVVHANFLTNSMIENVRSASYGNNSKEYSNPYISQSEE